MPLLDIEIIAHGPKKEQILSLSSHVKKYTESFVYTTKIPNINIPISYYESKPLDAWRNIHLVDKTYVLPANNIDLFADEYSWLEIPGTSFTSKYKSIDITYKQIVDKYGKMKPVFRKHSLPPDTIDAQLEVIENGNLIEAGEGLLIDLKDQAIYTNYTNYFNPDTGSYRLYFVTSSSSDGKTYSQLLDAGPVVPEASWKDVDLETGKITKTSYTTEGSSAGFTFHLHKADEQHCDENDDGSGESVNFFVKPNMTGAIKPRLPAGKQPEDPWHIRFTNGMFYQYSMGKLRRYWIPEWHRQPWAAEKPFIHCPYRNMLWVNRNTIAATRPSLAIDPANDRNFTLYVYDKHDVLLYVYTTDKRLENKRFSDTDVFYNTEMISSWDNSNGFIHFGIDMDPGNKYYAEYFYRATDYEFSSLTLNPLQNRDSLNNMWVFYLIPDTHPNDRALHVLGVDEDGYIVSCSQVEGRKHPNLQLVDDQDNYNPDTVIGMKYASMTNPKNFRKLFTAPFKNPNQYYILAEISVLDIGDKKDSFVIDLLRPGSSIDESHFKDAIKANPKILQSIHGYGKEGQTVPQNNVMLLEAPITLLEEFGGVLTKDKSEALLKQYLSADRLAVINWDWNKTILEGKSMRKGEVDLKMTWEGRNLIYNIYRRLNPLKEWEYLTKIVNPIEGDILYTDSHNLDSGYIYYYSVRLVENGVELPHCNMLGVMVA